MKRLHPNRVVRLVDGGVHDNQDVSSLLEQDCTLLLVSDASGQMRSADRPGGIAFQVLSRSSEILSSRVRETEYHDTGARQHSSRLHGLMFVHLKKDLTGPEITWIPSGKAPTTAGAEPSSATPEPLLPYGIAAKVQRLLSEIRTDVDSSSDVEAYALMLSG